MSSILAIDPGPEQSAWVVFDGRRIEGCGIEPNIDLLDSLRREQFDAPIVAIEGIQSFGMAVGAEVFQTCIWIGRYLECVDTWETESAETKVVYRSQVKLHLCGTARAKDPNIRQAIVDRFGGKERAIGRKANQGPLYAVKSHCWSALAVALTCWDTNAITRTT